MAYHEPMHTTSPEIVIVIMIIVIIIIIIIIIIVVIIITTITTKAITIAILITTQGTLLQKIMNEIAQRRNTAIKIHVL